MLQAVMMLVLVVVAGNTTNLVLARASARSKEIGLMLALECQPGKNYASRIQSKCMEKGLLVLTTSIYDTLRFIPPLNISQEDMAKGCQIVKEAIDEVALEG